MTSFATPSAADREQMLAQLDESLARNPDLDAADRESILGHFREALEKEAAATATAGTAPGQHGPDRNQWMQTLDMLAANDMLSPNDREALVQQFDRSIGSLQSEALDTAMEFAKRCQRDGEASAREWLAARKTTGTGAQTGADHGGLPTHVAMALQRRR